MKKTLFGIVLCAVMSFSFATKSHAQSVATAVFTFRPDNSQVCPTNRYYHVKDDIQPNIQGSQTDTPVVNGGSCFLYFAWPTPLTFGVYNISCTPEYNGNGYVDKISIDSTTSSNYTLALSLSFNLYNVVAYDEGNIPQGAYFLRNSGAHPQYVVNFPAPYDHYYAITNPSSMNSVTLYCTAVSR